MKWSDKKPSAPADHVTSVFSADDILFLQKFERRVGHDLVQLIFDNIWEDYKHDTPCLWDENDRNLQNCSDCGYLDNCHDAVRKVDRS